MEMLVQIAQMRATGEEPFAYAFSPTHKTKELQSLFAELPNGEEAQVDGGVVYVAGRVMASRFMGKLAFIDIADESGSIQVVCLDERNRDRDERPLVVHREEPFGRRTARGLHLCQEARGCWRLCRCRWRN